MSPLFLLLLLLLVFGGLPTWGHHQYGYVPSGFGGILFLVVLVLLLTGRM